MVFGAIHCLGWNFLFQRHTEQILWRVASIGMVCSPPLVPLCIFQAMLGTVRTEDRLLPLENGRWISDPALFFGVLFTEFYVFARVTIIVLMFLSLRSLPPGTYDTVAWTQFIPHVNT
ncbi:hypothetical protein DFJ58DRAFT_670048 [Suillus subalutaceus]|uniref:uncharacterized protein n=1 Tax=Suillus subalutaceus TaxID=48586 RepID=UPI001B882281|nr:uncharacterized protein DFJ58DRAFT_670048 [Suillus subalutaceus]KAG1836054.1 hypothetical protein DFJ58DRAFT_670048 [Suillus subalutaceus]